MHGIKKAKESLGADPTQNQCVPVTGFHLRARETLQSGLLTSVES